MIMLKKINKIERIVDAYIYARRLFLLTLQSFYESNNAYCYFITSKNGCIHPKVMCND